MRRLYGRLEHQPSIPPRSIPPRPPNRVLGVSVHCTKRLIDGRDDKVACHLWIVGSRTETSKSTESSSPVPFTTALTTPPPAVPSKVLRAKASWAAIICCCICWACCMICCIIFGHFGHIHRLQVGGWTGGREVRERSRNAVGDPPFLGGWGMLRIPSQRLGRQHAELGTLSRVGCNLRPNAVSSSLSQIPTAEVR